MDPDLNYPIWTRPLFTILVFVVCLLTFDLVFIRLWPLTQRTWKKVDYIWLGVAALGIVGAAGAVRRQLAVNYEKTAAIRAEGSYEFAHFQMSTLSGRAVCIKFVESEFSPLNLKEDQAEYDRVCDFGRAALNKVPQTMPTEPRLPELGPWPEVNDRMLKEMLDDVHRAIDRYYSARENLDRLHKDAEYSWLEELAFFLSPFLFAVALGLRITKVTGELRGNL